MKYIKRAKWILILNVLLPAILAVPAFADDELLYGGMVPQPVKRFIEFCSKIKKFVAVEADPVHLLGGEFYHESTDAYVKGVIFDLAVKRFNSSRSEYNSRYGYGWDMNYNIKVQKLKDPNSLILLTGENRKLEYLRDPDSDPNKPTYKKSGLYNRLAANADGTYTLIEKDLTRFDFDINGCLISITDRNGNDLYFEYDPNGLMPLYGPSPFFLEEQFGGPDDGRGLIGMSYRLTKVSDEYDRSVSFTYDTNGLMTGVSDFGGRVWSYVYDVNNDLETVTGPNTPEYPSGQTTSYAYDNNHNLLTITDANGNTYLYNHYDANDRVDEQTYGYGTYLFDYDSDSNSVTVTDRRGHTTTTVYNDAGQPLSYTVDTNGLRQGDPNSYVAMYEYDQNADLVREISATGNCTEYVYDVNGNITTVILRPDVNTYEPNISCRYTYESRFNFIKTSTDPLGYVTTYIYDYEDVNDGNEAGNLTKIVFPEVSTPDGNVLPELYFNYNQLGQIISTTQFDGLVSRFIYYDDVNDFNNFGRLWKVVTDYSLTDPNALNITAELRYDEYGRVIETTDPNGNTCKFEFNQWDELIRTTSAAPFNYSADYIHNANGEVIEIRRSTGQSQQVIKAQYDALDNLTASFDALGYITRSAHDAEENLIDVNDAEGNHTTFDYDERNLLWKTADANNGITTYSYTANGLLSEVADANGNKTGYEYDVFDRLICVTYPDDSNETTAYDKFGRITSFKDRSGQVTHFEYDAMDRLTVEAGPSEPNIAYRYDIAGRLYDLTDGNETVSYIYDRIGRLIDVNDQKGRTLSYDYDDRGLRTLLNYPDDSNVTYSYDQLGRLTEIAYEGTAVAQYEYDVLSRRTLLTLGNDANTVYEYDLGNRLGKLTNNINDTNSIVYEYADYDKVGNRLTCKIDDANEHVYSYDQLYRVVDVDYNDGNLICYSYDKLDNRSDVNQNGTLVDYSSNALNQYTSVGTDNFSYDNNGNLTNDGVYRYYYDSKDRLTDVNDINDTSIASYSYDLFSRRSEKHISDPAETVKYSYDGARVIAEYDVNDTLISKYIYGLGVDEPVCIVYTEDSAEAVYYYHYDGIGSVIALSNSNNEIVERYSYDIFGQVAIRGPNGQIRQQSAYGNSYMFTARRFDDETGLYYYRARHYNPQLGRFLQPDPSGYSDGLNLYTYCSNNPLIWVDPSGLCKERLRILGEIIWAHPGNTYRDLYDRLTGISLQVQNYYQVNRGLGCGPVGAALHTANFVVGKQLGYITLMEGIMGIDYASGQQLKGWDRVSYCLIGFGQTGLSIIAGAEGLHSFNSMPAATRGGAGPVKMGQSGVKKAGVVKNTERIPSASGKANYRVPDVLNHKLEVIGEVKNVKYQPYTAQLKDYVSYAKQNNYRFELYIKQGAQLSKPLQKAVNAGDVILKHYK